ncbi:metallophosphoesterase family protein [bacterium]|nr:metallophosphoesterase family protein [bacterium]
MVARDSLSLLVGADMHNSTRGAEWFLDQAQARQPDVLVFLGDFITSHPMSLLKETVNALRALAPRSLVIPGNHDPREAPFELDIAAYDGMVHLHKTDAMVRGYRFAGLGGSITTPVGTTPLELPDEGFADALAALLPADVWVLHNPLRGFCDKISGGQHVGSRSLHELWSAQDEKPLLVLSGHIHEAYGQDEAQGTTFVNPGPLLANRAAWITLADRSLAVELLEG